MTKIYIKNIEQPTEARYLSGQVVRLEIQRSEVQIPVGGCFMPLLEGDVEHFEIIVCSWYNSRQAVDQQAADPPHL